MKYLVSSYTGLLWAVYSGTVQEVRWARDLVCVMEVGRCGYPPIIIGITMKKIIMKAWAVTMTF